MRNAKSLCSARGVLLFDVPELADDAFPRMMIEMDAPRHTRYRLLVNRGFTPRMINRLEEFTAAVANRAVDRVLELGDCDFVAEVAKDLPMRVIAELLGVPDADLGFIADTAEQIIGFDQEDGGGGAVLGEANAAMCAYASRLGAEKRSVLEAGTDPGDIVSALLTAHVDGDRLSEEDFELFFLLLSTAGNETTRTAIAQGMLAFLEHPGEWQRLRDDRSLLASAIEEVLRYTTPLFYFRRTATRDQEVGAKLVHEGDHVVFWHASANFDETVFDDPLRFDIGRSPNDHLTFGSGPHYCLGAHLARLELRVMFGALLDRVTHIEQTAPAERIRSNFTNGVKRMPVRVS